MSCLFQLFTQNTRYPGVLSQYILTIIILFRVLLFFFFFFSLILFRLILPFEIQLSFTVKMMQLRDEEGSTPSTRPLSPPLSPPKARAEIKKLTLSPLSKELLIRLPLFLQNMLQKLHPLLQLYLQHPLLFLHRSRFNHL